MLSLKKLMPVRLIKNKFFYDVEELDNNGGHAEQLAELLGRGRSKRGMFEGELEEGELEIGQISYIINEIKPAAEIVADIIREFNIANLKLSNISF